MKILWHTIAILFVVVIFFSLTRFVYFVSIGKQLAQLSTPFEYTAHNPELSILVVGDSTAVGTGAAYPEDSVAGLFHKKYPNVTIVNLADDGLHLRQITQSLRDHSGAYDLVLLHGGGNDIIYFASPTQIQQDMAAAVEAAQEKSDRVVVLTSGNIGLAPIFPKILAWWYIYRSQKILPLLANVTQERGAIWIDLYRSESADPLGIGHEHYYAEDKLHLNKTGYSVWFDLIERALEKNNIHF